MIKNLIKKISGSSIVEVSPLVASNHVIEQYWAESDFPFLVSYPRTGSHWLRIMLEKYSDKPMLVRSFYEHNNLDYLLYHTHDIDLTVRRKKVIYLYRYPTDVIFSTLKYYKQDYSQKYLVNMWTSQYANHLIHWLFKEAYVEDKLILKYENLKNNASVEFNKLCLFLNLNWEESRFQEIYTDVTKAQVERKTKYNSQVINNSESYENERMKFFENYDMYIREKFLTLSEEVLETNFLYNLFWEK